MDNSFRKTRRREYLTPEEVERLLAASKSGSRNPVHDYCMLLLMFRHGLRVSELCSIKLSDIKVETKEFHVKRLKGLRRRSARALERRDAGHQSLAG